MRKRLGMLVSFLVLAGSLGATVADAHGPVRGRRRVHDPRFGGNGCPAGSVSVVESEDGSSVSLLFDQFQVEAGGATGRRTMRMTCDFTLPIAVPDGYRMGVLKIDYRGFNHLPALARSQLTVDYSFARSRAPSFFKMFGANDEGGYTVTDRVPSLQGRWTECGADVEMTGTAAITVNASPRGDESALTTLDTLDASRGGLVYQLQLKPCDPEPPRAPAPPERPGRGPGRDGPGRGRPGRG